MAPCSLVPARCFELMPAICALIFRTATGDAEEWPVNPGWWLRNWRRLTASTSVIPRVCSSTDSIRVPTVQSRFAPRPSIARRWIVDVMRSPLIAKVIYVIAKHGFSEMSIK